MEIHALFDGLAWMSAALVTVVLRRWFAPLFPSAGRPKIDYLVAVAIGAGAGAYLLGSVNIWIAGRIGFARSIEGSLAGAILTVELYKWRVGLRGRTAALFALPVAVGIGVGRIGCYLAGLDDFTYGAPTDLAWGHDFGDGVMRHPVQLYETAAMAVFALGYLAALGLRQRSVLTNGFALFALFYATQRFLLEFLKPYPPAVLGLTVFQVVCVAMVIYALVMVWPRRLPSAERREREQPDADRA